MRALREQPRVAVAKTLAVVCLVALGVAAGVAVGALLEDGDRHAERATQLRLISLQRAAHERQAQLDRSRVSAARAEAALVGAERRARMLERANARLRRELRAAQRSRRRARRQP